MGVINKISDNCNNHYVCLLYCYRKAIMCDNTKLYQCDTYQRLYNIPLQIVYNSSFVMQWQLKIRVRIRLTNLYL